MMRESQRASDRAERARLAMEKDRAKSAALRHAQLRAEAYNAEIALLTGAHRIQFKRRDWASAAAANPQPRPAGLVALFGRRSRAEDPEFAQAVLEGDPASLGVVVDRDLKPQNFAVRTWLLRSIAGRFVLLIGARSSADMPQAAEVLLQSGKLSTRPLSTAKRNELHRDYVCSWSVRLAAEVLQALPIDPLDVLVGADVLDRRTGHILPRPVLHMRTSAQALAKRNLPQADATPLAEGLGATLSWSAKDGLRAIDLTDIDLPLAVWTDVATLWPLTT